MNRILVVLFLFCAATGWAQQPLLTTQWTQEAPYNQQCPADPLENNKHCYAGCPAVVMGQILNHLRTTQDTRFDDGDDYNQVIILVGSSKLMMIGIRMISLLSRS